MDDIKTVFAGRRILVIEDDVLLGIELMEELETIGAEPIGPVMSVTAALHAVQTYQRIDAALMNVKLRGETSVAVADALIERHIPFLFVTGDDTFVRELYPQIPYHPKPAQMPMLIEALATVLSCSKTEQPHGDP